MSYLQKDGRHVRTHGKYTVLLGLRTSQPYTHLLLSDKEIQKIIILIKYLYTGPFDRDGVSLLARLTLTYL